MNKQPEQTARTRQSIIDAFWALAEKQGVDKVTVCGVTKKSGISRATFYAYFLDMPDLIEQEEQKIIDSIKERILNEDPYDDPERFIQEVINISLPFSDRVLLLLNKNGDPNFYEKLKMGATEIFSSLFEFNKSPYFEYIMVSEIASFIAILHLWYFGGKTTDIAELSRIFYTLTMHGIVGLTGTDELRHK